MELARCGYCGDLFPAGVYSHECWLARKSATQESLEPPEKPQYLEIGQEAEDSRIPARIRVVDISNL